MAIYGIDMELDGFLDQPHHFLACGGGGHAAQQIRNEGSVARGCSAALTAG